MAVFAKGKIGISFGIIKLQGELSDEDRQCAWELYTELSTRVAVTGKPNDISCKNFEGECLIESLESLYVFFQEARRIMRKFPVGRILEKDSNHLGIIISHVLSDIVRPFLEKWQIDFRHWWEHKSNPRLIPMERQKEYPLLNDFLVDWSNLRQAMRDLQMELIKVYELVNIYKD